MSAVSSSSVASAPMATAGRAVVEPTPIGRGVVTKLTPGCEFHALPVVPIVGGTTVGPAGPAAAGLRGAGRAGKSSWIFGFFVDSVMVAKDS